VKRLAFAVLSALLLVTSCSDETNETTRLQQFETLALNGVRQYLQEYCDFSCFGATLGFESAEVCVEDQLLRFPFSDCDSTVMLLDEDSALDYLDCLQRNANRAAACLIDCDASLVLTCEETFQTLDTNACEARLSLNQRDALQICARERQGSR
jgi:hypothetical protein